MRRTSALILIGNEILSGRTKDENIQFLALRLGELGIPLREIRVIPDIRETIINTVTEMRAKYDEVFTTGGIGPTHDDITAPCVAEAFGVPWEIHPPTFKLLETYFGPEEFNAARQRMAKLPQGATPIVNPVSLAPGFSIGNVHVMAGVPRIMRGMFDSLAPSLQKGAPVFLGHGTPHRFLKAHWLTDWRIFRIAFRIWISAPTLSIVKMAAVA